MRGWDESYFRQRVSPSVGGTCGSGRAECEREEGRSGSSDGERLELAAKAKGNEGSRTGRYEGTPGPGRGTSRYKKYGQDCRMGEGQRGDKNEPEKERGGEVSLPAGDGAGNNSVVQPKREATSAE